MARLCGRSRHFGRLNALADHCAFGDDVDIATVQANVFEFAIGQVGQRLACQALVIPGHNRGEFAADERCDERNG